ncbi:MAG: MATE family efflux transporter [Gammaproteobacteria bacterium]|nr:MAG: MATE family efflux transporter [Gammaproteobacteria bacterium]
MSDTKARFVTGSTLRHVIVMTLTNTIGIMALFLVDLIDLYFLTLLGEQAMAAAVGFSAQILFYVTGISIGLLIASGILVSQRIGAKQVNQAKDIAASALVIAFCLVASITLLLFWQLEPILQMLGAKGRTLELSITYLTILLPSSVIMVLGMVASSILRAVGDAKRSMNATLFAALVNLVLDPLLIFSLDMGIAGAAIASFISRISLMLYAMYCLIKIHKMFVLPSVAGVIADAPKVAKLAVPAVLTNLATPIGSTFVMTAIAKFGDSAVAAFATIGRIVPVAFAILFALSGAISPIIGQNFGAGEYARIKQTYHDAIKFVIVVVVIVTMVIFLSKTYLVSAFHLSGEASSLVMLFCSGLTLFFIADGVLFSTNSAFNSLGYPLYSTFFNYAKFFLGVIPTVYFMANIYGAKGVIIGQAVGSILVAMIAVVVCSKLINSISSNGSPPTKTSIFRRFTRPMSSASSSRTQM